MVLGLRSKHKRGDSVKVDYIVRVQEIRPWPPSESLRSVQSVLLQWENGDKNSGSFLSFVGDSNIVFNESFMLPLTLYRDKKARDKFEKNYLKFSLFEPRKDKAKGQILGTSIINLADYGVIEHDFSINASVTFKKRSNNLVQPALILSLEPVKRGSSNSSPNVGLSNEASLDNDDNGSEIASFTDDDVSSHSSRTVGSSTFEVATSSPSQNEKNGYVNAGIDPEQNRIIRPVSTDASSDTGNQVNDYASFFKFSEQSMTAVEKNSVSHNSHEVIANSKHRTSENTLQSVEEKPFERFAPEAILADNNRQNDDNSNSASSLYSHASKEKMLQPEAMLKNDALVGLVNVEEKKELKDSGSDDQIMDEMRHFPENKLNGELSEDDSRGLVTMRSKKVEAVPLPSSNKARLKHAKSVHTPGSVRGNGFLPDIYTKGQASDVDIPYNSQKKGRLGADIERIEPKGELSDCKDEWKTRIEMLEEELREAAATEVGLYSIVAEHASSGNKVHAPARRLSRFYTNACKTGSQAKRASAARAAVAGLVLVSKACGNDVPRLTFWLSNSIMLRAIVSQTAAELPHSNGPERKSNGTGPESIKTLPQKWADSSLVEVEQSKSTEESDEDVLTFIIALEKVESWLFSRIVESIWWQTFTPHMQPTVAKGSGITGTKKTCGTRNNLGDHEQGNFSTELWKKAFKDACERLCPIRAGGHECGCLSVLVRLVMEQLVNRLDVAMFNAILRESAEEMPTDPLSDPISDSKVLPIPAGKSSFGAGVELKNAIGVWSRWLTDLFGLDDDSTEDIDILEGGKKPKSFKAFRLLHALSNLMMLPFGVLADASTIKQVCPTFGPSITKRVLNNFVPDEFCPDPIPQNIIDTLDTEDISDASGDLLTSFPCTASPTEYSPPPAALLTCAGEVGSQVLQSSRLSTLKKSYTSDDELDELDSPFTSIVPDIFQNSALAKLSLISKEKGGRNIVRYQLLREIWKDDE